MLVISLVNAPAQLRGYLTRFLSEAQAGLFVGEVSARVRDLLWQRINKDLPEDGKAMIAYNMDNEQGYIIDYLNGDRVICDLDGLQIVGLKKKSNSEDSAGVLKSKEDRNDKHVKHWSNAYWRRRR